MVRGRAGNDVRLEGARGDRVRLIVYGLLADLIVLIHLAFVVFVVVGAFLVLRWPTLVWLHVPSALYGAAIEFWGWVCPLTPLENRLRRRAGEAGYGGGFIEEYLLPILYPGGLTREIQIVLGTFVVVANVAVYIWIWRRARGRGAGTPEVRTDE